MAELPKDKFGLRNQSQVTVNYNVEKQSFTVNGSTSDDIYASDYKQFNIPICIYVEGIPYYPSKYETVPSGICHYHSMTPPITGIRVGVDTFWNGDRKEYKKNIKLDKLREYNNSKRLRKPSEYTVMGESAKAHAKRCIDRGLLSVIDGFNVDWHWCHLIAFSMLSAENAQIKKNLVCGTAPFNGQMINIEQAVKHFIYKHKRHLLIEVKADIIQGTHLATRLGYSVYDKKTGRIHTEYFNPLTITYSDVLDEVAIYNRLVNKFEIES
ncbi:hypothetical protein ABGT22_19990 [Peribacillus frigoritolerans]|uniref:hypothetical protein n=1 Tax=Peribacillus frigoritolerans TaxID=450367 RepID=UPI00345D7A2A